MKTLISEAVNGTPVFLLTPIEKGKLSQFLPVAFRPEITKESGFSYSPCGVYEDEEVYSHCACKDIEDARHVATEYPFGSPDLLFVFILHGQEVIEGYSVKSI